MWGVELRSRSVTLCACSFSQEIRQLASPGGALLAAGGGASAAGGEAATSPFGRRSPASEPLLLEPPASMSAPAGAGYAAAPMVHRASPGGYDLRGHRRAAPPPPPAGVPQDVTFGERISATDFVISSRRVSYQCLAERKNGDGVPIATILFQPHFERGARKTTPAYVSACAVSALVYCPGTRLSSTGIHRGRSCEASATSGCGST
ncbi:hypothetical protein HPB50_004498 [Hyalomma asiaticum]|uniref:Uncharacterized protein n=1 Tax=Hyalomma asiaticum TaxID=266040 RepID=A0ACB7TH40_HYAAI|nr:hypothetical protein HPB50_004498 [Hyalomma asiaticum]